jgi:hypothetical protein
MARKPLAVKLDEELIDAIDAEVSASPMSPSRIAMINHLLWLAIRMRGNVEVAAERLYRMQNPDGDAWFAVTANRKRNYLDLARQMIEDMSQA